MLNSISKIVLLVSFFFVSTLQNQAAPNTVLDSLLSQKPMTTDLKLTRYIELASIYRSKDKVKSLKYIDSAEALLLIAKDQKIVSEYYIEKSHYYLNNANYDSLLIMLNIAMDIATKNNNTLHQGRILINYGQCYGKQDKHDSALYYYDIAIKHYDDLDSTDSGQNNDVAYAILYNNIGSVYLNKGDYEASLPFYYQALNIYEKIGNEFKSLKVLINIGNIYLFHHEHERALLEYEKALNILDAHPGKGLGSRASVLTNMGNCFKVLKLVDTSRACYFEALSIRKKQGRTVSIAGIYDNLGNLEKALGNYQKALFYLNMSLDIRKQGSSPRWLASSYGNLGLLYVKMHQYSKAIKYLKPAIEVAEKNSFVEIEMEAKLGLSNAYIGLGDYKNGLKYYRESRTMNDSIHSVQFERQLDEYKEKYEAEKKDRLIEHLEEVKKFDDAVAEKQDVLLEKQSLRVKLLSVGAGMLIVILILLQRFFRIKRRSDKEIFEKNEQLNQQRTLELMKEMEMGSFKSYMEGQEKERSRIAGDLHDRLGSLLSTVKLHFSGLEPDEDGSEESKRSYDFALSLLDNSVEEVRAVSRNLSKGVLIQFGLFAAVESMRDAINSADKIKMNVLRSGLQERLDPEVEIIIFRVVQELITNIIRHAQTNEAFVQFVGAEDRLNIIIEDHGIGFDKDNIESDGIGLKSLAKRVEGIGGEFDIDSVLGEGTTVIIDIPYGTKEVEEELN